MNEEMNNKREIPIPIMEREESQLNLKNKIGKSNTRRGKPNIPRE